MSDVYRQAASVLVLKPVEACSPDGCDVVYQLLLLHKPRKNDAWQLPQGGVEGQETLEEAAMRELHEEAGITATAIGRSAQKYQYDFPDSFRRFRPDNVCGQCIGYVFATVEKDTAVTVDGKEVDAYAWVETSQLPLYVQRPEYRSLVEELYEEALPLMKAEK